VRIPEARRQAVKATFNKLRKDNVGFLATVIAWNALTSIAPIMVGLIAISGFILQGHHSVQESVVTHLSAALRGVLTPADLNDMVHTATHHSGLLGVIGILGILWGGSNIGGAISTAFQPVFEVGGRNFFREKLLDIAMIFVITILMVVIIIATTYAALIHRLVADFPLSSATSLALGIAVSVVAGFMLFGTIYLAFPNTNRRLEFRHVWPGAAVAAILFEALTLAWPIYAHFTHFSRYGAVLLPILLLTAWIYLFSIILTVGAEIVAIAAIRDSNRRHLAIGPEPQNIVPQHEVLRET